MNTSSRNLPEPGIAFTVLANHALDATAALDFDPDGLRLQVHERWGADEYLLTLSRKGLQVTFQASLFHLSALEQALRFYVKRVKQERAWPTVTDLGVQSPVEQEATERTEGAA